jgi:peptidoglycan/LPS O-acetylase OafA/YrhL
MLDFEKVEVVNKTIHYKHIWIVYNLFAVLAAVTIPTAYLLAWLCKKFTEDPGIALGLRLLRRPWFSNTSDGLFAMAWVSGAAPAASNQF